MNAGMCGQGDERVSENREEEREAGNRRVRDGRTQPEGSVTESRKEG